MPERRAAGAVPPPPVLARCRVRRLGLVTHRGERPGSAALGFPSVRPSLFWLEQIRRGSRPHILSRNERRLRPGDENAPWMLPWVGVDHVTPSEPGGHSLSFRDDRKRRAPVFRFILSGGFYLGQVSLELPVHQWAGEAGSIGCRGGGNQALGHPSAPTGSHRRPHLPLMLWGHLANKGRVLRPGTIHSGRRASLTAGPPEPVRGQGRIRGTEGRWATELPRFREAGRWTSGDTAGVTSGRRVVTA